MENGNGRNLAVHELVQNQDGTLAVKLPDLSKNCKLHVVIPQWLEFWEKQNIEEKGGIYREKKDFQRFFLDRLPIHGAIHMKITFSEK